MAQHRLFVTANRALHVSCEYGNAVAGFACQAYYVVFEGRSEVRFFSSRASASRTAQGTCDAWQARSCLIWGISNLVHHVLLRVKIVE